MTRRIVTELTIQHRPGDNMLSLTMVLEDHGWSLVSDTRYFRPIKRRGHVWKVYDLYHEDNIYHAAIGERFCPTRRT